MLDHCRLVLNTPHPANEGSEPDLLQEKADALLCLGVGDCGFEREWCATSYRDDDQGRDASMKSDNFLRHFGYPGAHGAQHRTGKVWAREEGTCRERKEMSDALLSGIASQRVLVEQCLKLLHLRIKCGDEDVLFTTETGIERSKRDTRVRCDIAQAHSLEPALVCEVHCALDDSFGPFFHASCLVRIAVAVKVRWDDEATRRIVDHSERDVLTRAP